MTQEDKELLLKDLCARLPYGVKGIKSYNPYKADELSGILPRCEAGRNNGEYFIELQFTSLDCCVIERFKPYLRPISSMTDEEVDNLFKILDINEDLATEWLKVNDIGIIRLFTQQGKDFYEIAEAMDYLNSIHIDYRGLIEESLAIDVTKGNNPYKE